MGYVTNVESSITGKWGCDKLGTFITVFSERKLIIDTIILIYLFSTLVYTLTKLKTC